MSDAARYLPLSQRAREDESGVTNDWSDHLAATLLRLAELVDTLTPDQLQAPTGRDGYRVLDALGHLHWRLNTSGRIRLTELVGECVRLRCSPRRAALALSRAHGERLASASVAAGAFRDRSLRAAAPEAKTRVPELSVAVVDGYDIALSAEKTLTLDPRASGAVALARSLSAPTPIRAVLSDRALTAVDGHWTVGHGSVLRAAAQDIVLFLWGRRGIPVAAPESDPEPEPNPQSTPPQ